MRDVGVMRGAVPARMRHVTINGKEVARAFPIKRNNRRRTAHLPSAPSPFLEPPSLPSSFSSSRFRSPPPRLPLFLIPWHPPAAMAPKTSKGKGAAMDAGEEESSENKLAVLRT